MRKAQIQNLETIMIVIILLLIIIGGIIFYGRMQKGEIKQEIRTQKEINLVSVLQIIRHMDEIECSTKPSEDCVDYYKAKTMSELEENNDEYYQSIIPYYYPLLGDSEIIIREIFPSQETFVIYNASTNASHKESLVSYTPLYDRIKDQYYFGVIEVNYYYDIPS